MADTYTGHLRLRKKGPMSTFSERDCGGHNNWGQAINADLDKIDSAIGDVCSPEQIAAIRERLQGDLTFFRSPADV